MLFITHKVNRTTENIKHTFVNMSTVELANIIVQLLRIFGFYLYQASETHIPQIPGYGFANAPLPVVEKWQRLLKSYLSGRPSLRRVFLLIDARHGPKKVDTEIMGLLSKSAVTFQIVMTKCDKLKTAELEHVTEKTIEAIRKYPAAYPEIVQTSAAKGDGIETLRAIVAGII